MAEVTLDDSAHTLFVAAADNLLAGYYTCEYVYGRALIETVAHRASLMLVEATMLLGPGSQDKAVFKLATQINLLITEMMHPAVFSARAHLWFPDLNKKKGNE